MKRLKEEEGKSLAEIGRVYGISKVAVFKRLKTLEKRYPVNLTKLDILETPGTCPPAITLSHEPHEVTEDVTRSPVNGGILRVEEPTAPKYLRKKDTGEVFIATRFLLQRADMEPYSGPVPWAEKKESVQQAEEVFWNPVSKKWGKGVET